MGHTLLGNADRAHRSRNRISDRMLDDYSGLGEATPEYWIDGRQHRPLRRRHSGKGRAVPVRLSLIPNRLRVRAPVGARNAT